MADQYRIVCDGRKDGTHVYAPSGVELTGVEKLWWGFAQGSDVSEAHIVLRNVAIEVSAVRPLRDLPLVKRVELWLLSRPKWSKDFSRLESFQIPREFNISHEDIAALILVGVLRVAGDMLTWCLPLGDWPLGDGGCCEALGFV